ncbi:MAG TPA: dihydroneopterin aldolase [Candidatus Yaniella excrementavium]|nr:dihydroneopterin aldolase [Candidatus Yaniella excrementavium]
MGTIRLTGLRARGYHGVLDHERANGQTFIVDLDLDLDIDQAADTDDVAATVNYAEVAAVVENIITGPPVNLIETLAVTMADTILADFSRITSVRITINKPQAPIPADFSNVAVTVARHRSAAGRS